MPASALGSPTLTAPTPSLVDRLRPAAGASLAVQALGVAVFTGLIVLGAQVRWYVWEVPVTLQTLAVYSAGLFLGARGGAASALLYLALGLVFPVFAGDAHGPAYLLGTTGGYLLGLPLDAAVAGRVSERWNTLAGSTLSLLAGSLVLFACGVTWLHYAAGHATWAESLDKGWLRFLPFDLLKVGATALAYTAARRLR